MVIAKQRIDAKLIVTCLNEEGNVQEFIDELMAHAPEEINLALVLVNNGSSDQTGLIIDSLARKYECITTVQRETTLDYGKSILDAHRNTFAINSDYIGWAPSDNQITGKDTAKALEFLVRSRSAFVKAVRYEKQYSLWRRIQSHGFNIIISILFRQNIADINGAPKLFRTELVPFLDLDGKNWFLDGEVFLKATKLLKKSDFSYVPVRFNERMHGKTKTSWFTALELFLQILEFRLWKMPRWLKQLNAKKQAIN